MGTEGAGDALSPPSKAQTRGGPRVFFAICARILRWGKRPQSGRIARWGKVLLVLVLGLWGAGGCIYFEDLRDLGPLKDIPREERVSVTVEKQKKELLVDPEIEAARLKKLHGHKIYYLRSVQVENNPISRKKEIIPQFINFFHWTTEAGIIRQEILYLPGWEKATTHELLQESERNLRGTSLFNSVHISYVRTGEKGTAPLTPEEQAEVDLLKAEYAEEGKEVIPVDLAMVTRDRITNLVAFAPTGGGGVFQARITGGERNLFGRRYLLNGAYARTNSLNQFEPVFGKERLFGTRWNMQVASAHDNYEGDWVRNEGRITAEKPFFSLRTPWAYELEARAASGTEVKFDGQNELAVRDDDNNRTPYSALYNNEILTYQALVSRVFGTRERWTFTFGGGQVLDTYEFVDQVPGQYESEYLPTSEESHYLLFGFGFDTLSYLKTRNFKKYIHEEDVRLGLTSKFTVKQTLPALGLASDFTELTGELGYSSSHQNLFFYALKADNRNRYEGEEWVDNETNLLAGLFWGFSPLGYFANLASYSFGSELFAQSIFVNQGLDLRGLAASSLRGNRKSVVSFEFRSNPFTISYAAIGFVLFTDWGDVWRPGRREFRLRGTMGFGLRYEWYEFDNNVFRIDVGFPVQGGTIEGENMVSFGLSHKFDVENMMPFEIDHKRPVN